MTLGIVRVVSSVAPAPGTRASTQCGAPAAAGTIRSNTPVKVRDPCVCAAVRGRIALASTGALKIGAAPEGACQVHCLAPVPSTECSTPDQSPTTTELERP